MISTFYKILSDFVNILEPSIPRQFYGSTYARKGGLLPGITGSSLPNIGKKASLYF
jgi:hypothetical protein